MGRTTIVTQSVIKSFFEMFTDGDVDGAASMLDRQPELAEHSGYSAHPLLCEWVERNNGHCYKQSHLQIADLLIPDNIRSFRDAVIGDQLHDVQNQLQCDGNLVHSRFTAGRGIAQAIHHWKSVPVAEALVNADAKLDALTTRGESPLTMQLRFGTVAGARFLLENGANPNNGVGGHMPSHLMNDFIELLLAHGWDINRGQMLHDANHGHGTRVKTWLRYGADANARNESGQTALHLFAARGTGRGVIRALFDAGADINARDNNGQAPLDLARKATQKTAMHALISLDGEA